ncbi:MAG: carboxypeptidase regulatory-like domain-containing protein [Acidobacteria bacterium]|nr:carboxypeptidase regulatory-like domain-containing protein [Acidobacteriota bacterium]
MSFSFLLSSILSVCISLSMFGQESRGSISGRVSDPTGAVVPGAGIAITNTATNNIRRTTTNDTGYYEINLLEPSAYTVSVEAQGFKKALRSGLTLNVSARLDINFVLQIGGVAETIEVNAEAPLLETTTASGGRVLDQRQLVNLPFSDLNPFALTALAPGMQWTGQPEYRRPFDNGGTSSFNTMGGVGQNEYSIDGMTVTGTGRRVGYVPPADSITEFKLETTNFDASQGFTSGAAINVVSRSGSNKLSGSLFDQHWQQRWNATPHFDRLNWERNVREGRQSPDSQKQATGRSNNYGLTASGPVWIPKLYNGKNKFFWTFSWNGIKQSKAETTSSKNVTVPTAAMKSGDFSELLLAPNGASLYTVYDPRSARTEGGRVVRTPFPGNKGIPTLNPMAPFYLKLFPTPNNVPGVVSPEGFNNYVGVAMPKNENFNSIISRYDYVLNDKHRFNFRMQWNDRLADEYDWTYETARGLHANGLTRINRGGNFNYLYAMNSTNILDANIGVSRFEEGSRNTTLAAYGPKDVGLPDYLQQRAGAYSALPRLDFNNITDVSGGYPVIGTLSTSGELRLGMTTIKGSHSFKYGWQERRNYFGALGPGSSSGIFTFRNSFVRRADNDNVSSNHGLDFASFLMGLPTGIGIDTNGSAYYSTPRRAFFFQDDWRISNRLRVSLGLRYERESGSSERYNRAISRVFIPDMKLPITDDAKAAYARNPIPELPASAFNPVGGTTYFGQNGYDTGTKGTHMFLPKVGVVYQINDKTVIRAGWGMYMDTYNVSNDRFDTNGYSQSTGTPISNDLGLTFCCGVGASSGLASGNTLLRDPFPVRSTGARFDEPLANALGGMVRTGGGFDARPWDYRPDLQNRWRVGFQRELTRNVLLDVSYNGSHSSLSRNYRINFLPSQYWTTGTARNQANDDFMNVTFPNPFNINNFASLRSSNPTLYNWMAGQGFYTGTTIRRHQLLRAYPQFSGSLNGIRPGDDYAEKRGNLNYRDLQVLLERRFTSGLQTAFMWTWATSRTRDWLANEFDTSLTERVNNNVLPHRIAFTGTYELPVGKGRSLVKSGFLSHIIGNWNTGWVYQWQLGPAAGDWGNRFFYGDINKLGDVLSTKVHESDIHQWFEPATYRTAGALPSGFVGFDGRSANQPGSYHVRVFPLNNDAVRSDGISNLDLKVERMFPIKPEQGMRVRFSVDMLNALNHTNFSGPNLDPTNANFGKVTSQRGLARVIQFNLRFEF